MPKTAAAETADHLEAEGSVPGPLDHETVGP